MAGKAEDFVHLPQAPGYAVTRSGEAAIVAGRRYA